MKRLSLPVFALLFLAGFASVAAHANSVTLGYISFDVTGTNLAQFDIFNATGPNSTALPDPTFPIASPLSLSSLSLSVNYLGGQTKTFGSSYFTLGLDGLSFNGTPLSTLAAYPAGFNKAIGATLTGVLTSHTLTLNTGVSYGVLTNFSATISDPSGLQDADLGIINVTTAPEPSPLILAGTGLLGLFGTRRRWLQSRIASFLRSTRSRRAGVAGVALGLGCVLLLASAQSSAAQSVKLGAWTTPNSGAGGVTAVNITGSGFPSGTIPPANVTLTVAPACAGPGTLALVNSVTRIIGSSERVQFVLPGAIGTGTYYVSLSGTTSTGSAFSSVTCAQVNVTGSSPTANLSASSINFAVIAPGTTSPAQSVVLSNTGTSTLNLSSIALGGTDASLFTQFSDCGATLPVGGFCTITTGFKPKIAGAYNAAITFTDNASPTTQTVPLTGSALVPTLSLSPASLTFASQPVGSTSAPKPVTLTNTSGVDLAISGVTFPGPNGASFAQTSTCGSTVAAGASCTLSVSFTPSAAGPASASLNLADNASGSPQTVTLTGASSLVLSLTKVSSTEWDATNGILSFNFNPTNFGMTNLKVTLGGVTTAWLDPSYGITPFGHAIGFYTLYSYAALSGKGIQTANYSLTPNYLDMWITKANVVGAAPDPLESELHWIIRVGDPGVHFYQVVRHRATDPATNFGAATTNFFCSSNAIARADGTTLYYARDIGPNNLGVTNETFPTTAFTNALLAAGKGRQVQAETVDYTDVGGLGTYVSAPGLAREFITKYDYSTYEQFHTAHGFVGAQNAFWWVVPSHETFMGGPTKQFLTTVQIEYQSAHLGGSNIFWAAGEVNNRLFGPYYLHFNAFNATNQTADDLYADAASTIPGVLDFYDTETTLQANGYVPRPGRGILQASIASSGLSAAPAANVVMLTDNQTYFQESSKGYQYWGYADTSGNVTIPNIIPGTYRLSSYIIGQWGLFHADNVTVGATSTTLPGLNFQPRNFSSQPPIWTIGIPDRSAHEFLHGHDALGRDVRDYLAIGNYWKDLQQNLGKVVYTVGTSDIATSWPFIHYGSFYPGLYAGVYNPADQTSDGYNYITPQYVLDGAVLEKKTPAAFNGPNWEVHFTTTADQIAQGPYVLISINSAGVQNASLQVRINNKHRGALLWYPRLGSDPNVRSGVAGYNNYVVYQFPVSDLNPAGQDNVMTLYSSGAMLYDALKMEIGPNPADPAISGWPEYDWMYYAASGDKSTQQSASAP